MSAGGAVHTFARGGATVVFKVGAVLALVVLGAVTVVVSGQVEARRSVLTRVGRAVIDIQLGGWWRRWRCRVGSAGAEEGESLRGERLNSTADTVSATLNRAKPTASSQQARARKQYTRTALGEGGAEEERGG